MRGVRSAPVMTDEVGVWVQIPRLAATPDPPPPSMMETGALPGVISIPVADRLAVTDAPAAAAASLMAATTPPMVSTWLKSTLKVPAPPTSLNNNTPVETPAPSAPERSSSRMSVASSGVSVGFVVFAKESAPKTTLPGMATAAMRSSETRVMSSPVSPTYRTWPGPSMKGRVSVSRPPKMYRP